MSQGHAHAVSTREAQECSLIVPFRKAQPSQDALRFMLEKLAAVCGLEYTQTRVLFQFLRQITDAESTRHTNGAPVGEVLAMHHPQQRSFPRAIGANQPNPRLCL